MTKTYTHQKPRLLLIGLHAPYNKTTNIQSYFDEFIALVRSNDIAYVDTLFIKLRTIEPGTFITKGHLETILKYCKEHAIDEVLISEPISPQQERNLSEYLDVRVFDRTQLILEIFEKAAVSAEGKTQVAIAMIEHQKSRLAGKGKGMAQQRGIMGLRAGFGETMKERERRHLESLILWHKKELRQLESTRETQRKQRLKSNLPLICLVGYTNAGKSTILNALTKSNVLAVDRLFATLDTTTRELFINSKKRALLSDTVGFIQLLPPQLIEAFKSTLAELQYAQLLLHVVDIADPDWQLHISVVDYILQDLGITAPSVIVFNKADKVTLSPLLLKTIEPYQPHVIVSAMHKDGLLPLIEYIEQFCIQRTS
ncbi:MAG: GTPase HflX [Candidatus Babeliales bacterium]